MPPSIPVTRSAQARRVRPSSSTRQAGRSRLIPVTLTAPANNNLAPPGYYQLFLVNGAGVPSVGRMVRITTGGGAR